MKLQIILTEEKSAGDRFMGAHDWVGRLKPFPIFCSRCADVVLLRCQRLTALKQPINLIKQPTHTRSETPQPPPIITRRLDNNSNSVLVSHFHNMLLKTTI